MWESLSLILKAAAMAVIFSLLALGAGVGIVRRANRRARMREQEKGQGD